MKHTETLKLNRDFRRLYSRGKSFASGYVVVYCTKNRKNSNRLGFTVSKTIGNAVTRNRAKRLMRESYRLMEDRIKIGYDIIIVARTRIVGKTFAQVKKDTEYSLRKTGLID